jgi:predicted metal-dependent peptidase
MPLTESSWSRPSRRTLALGEQAVWIEAGIDRQRGLRRAGVVIDTSGSIDDALLERFLAEINSLIVKTGCEVVLVDCDAAVQQISLHRKPIHGYAAKGGGGTDFRPAMEALRRTPLDVAVYFTDLEGTFPEKKPPFPLLWLATRDLAVPFGRKVLLPKRGAQ